MRCVSKYVIAALSFVVMLGFLCLAEVAIANPATAVVYYVEVDKLVYEVGEPVFVNSSYFLEGSSSTLATFSIGFNSSAVEEKSFPDYGSVTRVVVFYLNPSNWSPGVNGTSGWAEVFVEAVDSPLDSSSTPYASDSETVFFTVVRAGQNCSLENIYPDPPVENLNVTLSFRLFNEHNASFPVVNNSVSFNVLSPNGTSILNGSVITNLNGEFVVEFNPDGVSGNYTIEIFSFENEDYESGRFTFVVKVLSSSSNLSKPTRVELSYVFAGNTTIREMQEVSYAFEPVKMFVSLFDNVTDSPISGGDIVVSVFDWRNVTVFNVTGVTNGSGIFEFVFSPPYAGDFFVYAEFLGNETFNSSNNTLTLPEFLPRPVRIEVIRGFPSVVYVGENYSVLFRVVDNFTGLGVSGVNVSLYGEWPMQLPFKGFKITNDSGYSEFQVEIPAIYGDTLPGYRYVVGWCVDARDLVVYENSSVIWGQWFREVSLTTVVVDSFEVMRGNSVVVEVCVCSDDGIPLNGTVEVYWDNKGLFNGSLLNGSFIFLLNISIDEDVGLHILSAIFSRDNYDGSFYNVTIVVKSLFDVSIDISSLEVCRGENCSFDILTLDLFNGNPISNVAIIATLNNTIVIFEELTNDSGNVVYVWCIPQDFQAGIYVVYFNISKEFYNSLCLNFTFHIWIRTTVTFNITISESTVLLQSSTKNINIEVVNESEKDENYISVSFGHFQLEILVKIEKFVGENVEQFEVALLFIVKDERLLFLEEVKGVRRFIA